jgi:uncharacterized protein (TIGR00290 family)
MKAYMNWSGGKDSSLALFKILNENKFSITHLLTSINKSYDRVSMHGVRRSLLEAQALSLNIPLKTIELPEQPTMEEYEQLMNKKVSAIHSLGISHTIFGDIFLEDLKQYRIDKLNPLGIEAHFPLWKIPTINLMNEFIRVGFKAIVVCVNANFLDQSFCGRIIDQSFVDDLPLNVDVCGENGEYHSFVFDGPIFKNEIPFTKGEIIHRIYKTPAKTNDDACKVSEEEINKGFYFCDLY